MDFGAEGGTCPAACGDAWCRCRPKCSLPVFDTGGSHSRVAIGWRTSARKQNIGSAVTRRRVSVTTPSTTSGSRFYPSARTARRCRQLRWHGLRLVGDAGWWGMGWCDVHEGASLQSFDPDAHADGWTCTRCRRRRRVRVSRTHHQSVAVGCGLQKSSSRLTDMDPDFFRVLTPRHKPGDASTFLKKSPSRFESAGCVVCSLIAMARHRRG